MRQFVVLMPRVAGFKLSHPVEVTQKELRREHPRINLLVPQFLEKTAITVVSRSIYDTQVRDGIIELVPINVVYHLAFRTVWHMEESAHHQVVTVFATVVVTQLRIDLVAPPYLAVTVRGIAVLNTLTQLVYESTFRMGIEDTSSDNLWRHLLVAVSGQPNS